MTPGGENRVRQDCEVLLGALDDGAATHICAADNLRVSSSFAVAFDLLERDGVADRALAEGLRKHDSARRSAHAEKTHGFIERVSPLWVCP